MPIEYEVELYGVTKKVTLPLVVGVIADLSGQSEKELPPFVDRKLLHVDRDNLDARVHEIKPRVALLQVDPVGNTLGPKDIEVVFESMADFGPEAIARKVSFLRAILDERLTLAELRDLFHAKPRLADDAFALERDNLDAPWKLEGKDGELDPSRASAIGFALAKLEVVDVAAAGADAGFDQGSLIVAATTDGLEYKLKIGKLDKDRYMVQVALDGTPMRAVRAAPADEKAEDKDKREKAAAEELKRFTERIAREKALGPFTVLIAKAKIDEVLKKRADLLKQEKKEEKK